MIFIATMTFWEWTGTAVIAGLSGGVGLKLVAWLKEYLDRRARKISFHAKVLLEQADRICGMARALLAVVQCQSNADQYRLQASSLWAPSSDSSLLNVWLANAWILRRRKLRRVRESFEQAIERLRTAARKWCKADNKARRPEPTSGRSTILTGFPKWPSREDVEKASASVADAFETFLHEFQTLHNALQPLVREYTSQPEAAVSEDG